MRHSELTNHRGDTERLTKGLAKERPRRGRIVEVRCQSPDDPLGLVPDEATARLEVTQEVPAQSAQDAGHVAIRRWHAEFVDRPEVGTVPDRAQYILYRFFAFEG